MTSWQAWHLHYHDDLDALLAQGVAPLIEHLAKAGAIDRFFFVRYQLAGPHLRLRLRLLPASTPADIGEHVARQTTKFFRHHPSAQTWDASKIHQLNARILASDPTAGRDEAVDDETVVWAPYEPELERYGGVEFFKANHDLFTLSSLVALERLIGIGSAGHPPRSRRIRFLPLLLTQILGSSADLRSAREVVDYPPPQARQAFRKMIEKAEALFDAQTEAFEYLCQETLTDLGNNPLARSLYLGARCLLRLLEGRSEKATVLGSHLHMTANRLGLSNAEEVYLSHLAGRCLESFFTESDFTHLPSPWPKTDIGQQLSGIVEESLNRFRTHPLP